MRLDRLETNDHSRNLSLVDEAEIALFGEKIGLPTEALVPRLENISVFGLYLSGFDVQARSLEPSANLRSPWPE